MNEPRISGHCVHNWLSLATPCPECAEARQGTLEIPEHICKAAATVEIFFKVNCINEWALMGVQSRRSEPVSEPTPTPPLARYTGGDPVMLGNELCVLLKDYIALEQQLQAERAAREQLEQECKAWEESTRDAHNAMARAEMAEAKLAEAMDVLQLLRDHQNGCPLPKYEKHWNAAMDRSQAIIDGTTPPPILAEVQRLRASCEARAKRIVEESEIGHKWCMEEAKQRVRAEHAALKLKLDVATVALRELTEPMGAFRKDPLEHARNIIENSIRVATEALSQLNESK